MSRDDKGKKSGNTAFIITGPLRGLWGEVIDFFQEEDQEGVIIPGGLTGFILAIEGVGKRALWREEVLLQR